MRLNRYLAACGLGSRRSCEELIRSGRVRVNGEPAHFGMVVADADRVTLDGRVVLPQGSDSVWMLHKPAGVVSTMRDPQGRPTLLDLVRRQGIESRLFPVGRLDFETTGLLLLTNDGNLSLRLTHPAWGIEKEYEATVERPLSDEALDHLAGGVDLDDGRTAPCRVAQEQRGSRTCVRLVLHEGRKRQVRRMLAAVGHPVGRLHRVRVGPLHLGDLPQGAMRALRKSERQALVAALERAESEAGKRPEPSA
ncbi:MAG: rRNA pseudouridine synthase [Candidatus Latescibacterota bacterium]|nr:MAG: rRNA pseudouridine synthase [Candidatus Latescibacterota bacterium]